MNNIRRTHPRPRYEAHGPSIAKALRGLVLVVEDEPDIRAIVAEYLTEAGFNVCVATDGETALQLIRTKRPAVVCLDLNLPRISGYDVCEQIRADPAIGDTRILITSARNSFDVKVFSLEAGADAYLIKPYGLKQLSDEVARLLALRACDVAERQTSPDEEPINLPCMSFQSAILPP
ncbi:MAG: response regulator [Polyangiaceae bacterium]